MPKRKAELALADIEASEQAQAVALSDADAKAKAKAEAKAAKGKAKLAKASPAPAAGIDVEIDLTQGEQDPRNLTFTTQLLEAWEKVQSHRLFPDIINHDPSKINAGGVQAPFSQKDLEAVLASARDVLRHQLGLDRLRLDTKPQRSHPRECSEGACQDSFRQTNRPRKRPCGSAQHHIPTHAAQGRLAEGEP